MLADVTAAWTSRTSTLGRPVSQVIARSASMSDPDHDLGRAEAGHLLGFLERDRAVIDDRADVRHGPRLHVGETLAFPADAPDGSATLGVDLEDERLRELGPHVERGAGSQLRAPVALPEPSQEGHGRAA